jgi:hypothetical protein
MYHQDLIKVGFRLGTLENLRHQEGIPFFSPASRLRPRALIALISTGVGSPLSIPFLISAVCIHLQQLA